MLSRRVPYAPCPQGCCGHLFTAFILQRGGTHEEHRDQGNAKRGSGVKAEPRKMHARGRCQKARGARAEQAQACKKEGKEREEKKGKKVGIWKCMGNE